MPYKDPKKQKEACKKYKRRRHDWLEEYKGTLACELCGYHKHTAALEFHHRNPKEKTRNVSRMMNQNASQADVMKEIRKCMVVCSNCHAIIHSEGR